MLFFCRCIENITDKNMFAEIARFFNDAWPIVMFATYYGNVWAILTTESANVVLCGAPPCDYHENSNPTASVSPIAQQSKTLNRL